MKQKIKKLLAIQDKLGEAASREFLQYHYSLPENIGQFLRLFPDHIIEKSPDFHIEVLNEFVKGGRVAIGAPRGFAKSTITNVISASYFAIYSKYHFILIISDTYTQAKMQLGALKSELENNEMLRDIYGELKGSTWGEDTIIVNGLYGEVMIKAVGAGMKIRGLKYNQYRPELAIIDDLENQEAVANKERRDKLERWFNYDLMPGLAKNGNIIYLGTILHYSALLKKVIDRDGKYESFRTRLYKAITDGKSIWPAQYTVEKLIAMRDNPKDPHYVGALVFAQEYQNEPQDDKDRMFQIEWLSKQYSLAETEHVWKLSNPDNKGRWHEGFFSKIMGGVDPAISEKTTADYFAMVTIGIAKETGDIYILDYFRDRIGDPMKQVQVILDKYEEWGHDKIRIETVAYQQGLYSLVRTEGAKKNLYPPLSSFKPDRDKVRRANVHSSNFSGGLVRLRTDHHQFKDFYEELLQFPLGEHDDMLDAYMNCAEDLVMKRRVRVFTNKASAFR